LPAVKPVSRRRSAKRATVSASVLALHLDCSRTYIGKLEAEGVIERSCVNFAQSNGSMRNSESIFFAQGARGRKVMRAQGEATSRGLGIKQ
jgi:hypothetical protein